MPGSEDGRTDHPVAFDRDLDLLLALGRFEQVCPERIPSGHRRLEWVLGVLDILGEEVGPGIAVERLPRVLVAFEQVAGGGMVEMDRYRASSSRCNNPLAIR
jgi:hypothetical protein